MWEQNETGLEGEFGEDIGPAIFRGGGLGDDPELTIWMVNEGHGFAFLSRPCSRRKARMETDPRTSHERRRELRGNSLPRSRSSNPIQVR